MECLSRWIVLISTLAAAVAHAALVSQTVPNLPWAAATAFAVSFALARFSLPVALLPPLLVTYAAPALVMVGFDVPNHHDVLLWLAFLAGPIVASSDWSRWHTPPTWTPLLVAWALVIAVTWPIVAGREIDFSLVAARTLDIPNGLGAGPPPLVAAAVTGVALGQLLGILWLDLLWARFGPDRLGRAERLVFVPLVASIALASLAGVYQRSVDIRWLGVDVWIRSDRAGALMLDANSFGMAAAIWSPLVIVLARRLKRPFWVGSPITALLLAGVWSAGSRTALLAASVGMLALVVVAVRGARAWQSRIAPLGVLVGAASLILFIALNSTDRSNPIARLTEMLWRVETDGLARFGRALWERDGYGLASSRAIAEHLWTGVGIGAFSHMSTDFAYVATGALPPADNAQNWWRQQIAELGILGAAPSIIFSILLVLLIIRGTASEDRRDAATVVRGVLFAVGIVSLFGVATQHPALLFTFVTMIYWFGSLVEVPLTVAPRLRPARAVWGTVVLLSLVVAAGQWRSATGDLRVPSRALRLGFLYGYGFSAPDGDNVPWTGRHAVVVMRAEHAYFAVTADAPRLAHPVRVRLWRGAQLITDVDSSGLEPITRIIAVPAGQRFLMLETEVSETRPDGRGLRLAGRWLREVPADARPETVVP